MLWSGIVFIVIAIFLSGKSYNNFKNKAKSLHLKVFVLSVLAGTFIAFFFPAGVNSFDPAFVESGKGILTPYSGVFFMAIGIVITTAIINPVFMRKPVEGTL